ncbi:MAG: hypothetical protein PVJ89_07950, partial [Planctomycetota bacterium]
MKVGIEKLRTGGLLPGPHFLAPLFLALFLAGPAPLASTALAAEATCPTASPTADPATEPGSGLPAAPPVLDRRRIRRITEISAELLELDAEALDRAANGYRASAPEDLVLAIILRAGRPVPPGLAAARRAQRLARAAEARAWLAREREAEAGRTLTDGCLTLALSPGGGGTPSIPELAIAASFVVADLELVEHAPAVARLLDRGGSAEVRRGARTALFRMYARSFEDLASFESRWGQLEGRAPALTGRDELRAALTEGDERALALLELAPARFDKAPLDWVDPTMGKRAARTLGRAVAGGALDPAAARALLVDGIEAVADPGELHARLGVLIDLVQGADPESDSARSVRTAVLSVAASSLTAGPDFVWVSLGALRRLEYPAGEGGDAERLAALERAVEIFRGALDARRARPLDPDALQAAVLAVRDVASAVEAGRDRQRGVRLLMRDLRALVLDEGLPLGVRRAAASSLTLSAAARDALQLVNLMRSPEAREDLGYELLGALKVVAGSIGPGSEAAETVLDRLFEFVAEPDFDRRRLALELLLSEEFAPLLGHQPRVTSARWATLRLQAEPSRDLRLQLVALLAELGDRETLTLLLGRDALVEDLVASDPGLARALCEAALEINGAAEPSLLLRLARRVAGPLGEAEALDPARVARLRAGVELVLGLDPALASALPARDSRWVVAAAVDLRRAFPVLALGQLDAAARATLRTQHVERLDSVAVESDLALASLARALIEADDLAAELREAPAGSDDEAAAADRARRAERALGDLDVAMAAPDAVDRIGWSPVDLALEGVELLQRLGRREAALLRVEALFEGETAEAATWSGRAVRTLVALALDGSTAAGAEVAVTPELRARADLASRALLGLIGQEGWSGELPATQLGDLDALLRLVRMGKDEAPR